MDKEYEINTIKDVLSIAPEHLDEFVEDIRKFHSSCKPLYDIAEAVGELDKLTIPKFVFKADGKGNGTINIQLTDATPNQRRTINE